MITFKKILRATIANGIIKWRLNKGLVWSLLKLKRLDCLKKKNYKAEMNSNKTQKVNFVF